MTYSRQKFVPIVLMVILVALAVGLGACGDGAARRLTGPEQLAARTVESFMGHMARGESEAACALLTDRAKHQLAVELGAAGLTGGDRQGECLLAVQTATDSYTTAERAALPGIRVTRVNIDGNRARVENSDTRLPQSIEHLRVDKHAVIVLVRTAQGWRIEDIG